uniref:Sulfotransferase domain-containing protein n=1 Tax=Panagrolaimus davidi TaxID=227884 RepID=A0A914PI17_9BILA
MEFTRVKLALTCLGLITIVIIQILYISSKLGVNCDIKDVFFKYEIDKNFKSNEILPAIERRRRLPDALIIGVRKGGTRALLDAMALHPQIKAARREVHFFDQNETYSLGIEWYRQQMPFSHSGQLTIEKTPAYFASSITPSRVYQLNKNMKIIIILRDPVIRTISDFTQVSLKLKKLTNKFI